MDKSISGDTAKLYRMIWSRFMASQMADCQQDTVSVTNINRQLCALHSTVGQYKADVVAQRCRDIDPDMQVYPLCATYDAAHREDFFTRDYDYVRGAALPAAVSRGAAPG